MSRLPQDPAQSTRPASVERLPDALVDQIAAGEVVERPASVVKELVENAVDAGASRVGIEVREGGAALVAVTDDGAGMTPADARLALERHATSKLRSLDDLRGIGSYGFRGEALPAIASVSRFRLRTRARGASEAIELRVERGVLQEERAASGPEGTRIEVADLFAGIPARRKFLKSATTEWGHVSDWLARAALALPGVHFDLRRDDRAATHWPAVDDPLDRIAAVLTEREAESLQRGESQEGGLRVELFASHPEQHRATAAGIYLFVNGRPVRDRLLRHAVLHVYRDLLPRGRFPTLLAFLDVPPGAVDVNVHPAKWEVRFAEPQVVHRAVRAAAHAALERRAWLGGGEAESAQPRASSAWPRSTPVVGAAATGDAAREPQATDWIFARQPSGSDVADAPVGNESPAVSERPFRFGELRVLGQLHAAYLLAESKQGLLLVDQHAAHERVLYERLREGWLAGGVERQALLVPLTLELDAPRRAALEAHPDRVRDLGFEVEAFGEDTVALRAVPALLADRDPAGILRSLADELSGDVAAAAGRSDTRLLGEVDRVFATLACHAARRAGDHLEPEEQRALLDSLDAIPWAPTCPHGRPVAVPFDLAEIERRFSRR